MAMIDHLQHLSAGKIREQIAILLEAEEGVWFIDMVLPKFGLDSEESDEKEFKYRDRRCYFILGNRGGRGFYRICFAIIND